MSTPLTPATPSASEPPGGYDVRPVRDEELPAVGRLTADVYIGDTGRDPYGPRPQPEVAGFAHELAWSLVKEHDAKAIVVACNTASTRWP